MTTERCAVCTLPFTEAEWADRHSDQDGEDIHEQCCELCGEERAS